MATEAPDHFGYADRTDVGATIKDLRRAGVDISGTRGGQTYIEFDELRDRQSVDNFEGYPCLDLCEAHWAGWRWAENQNIQSPDGCGGNSWSFYEGCVAYTEAGL